MTRSAGWPIHSGSVNGYQLRLGRQRQVWLIPIADEHVSVPVKLWNPLRTRVIPERFCGGDSLRIGAISSVCIFTLVYAPLCQILAINSSSSSNTTNTTTTRWWWWWWWWWRWWRRRRQIWDRLNIFGNSSLAKSLLTDQRQVSFIAKKNSPHSEYRLLALPTATCDLHLDDEIEHVSVALRLGLDLCIPHCGTSVDAWGLHALLCNQSRTWRHQTPSQWHISPSGVPATKKPDGLTLI